MPQIRERVILIASRNGKRVPYIRPTHSNDEFYGLPKWNTFRDAVKGLKENEMNYLKFNEGRLKFYRMLTDGQYWKHLPTVELRMEALGKSYFSDGGKTGFFRRLAWDKPSPTLVTSPTMPATDLAHPKEDRPLSIEEYKRIQQFPDDWILKGNLVAQYKQIGNAVPVGLGEALGRTLVDHLNGSIGDNNEVKDFHYSRYKNTNEVDWKDFFINQRKLIVDDKQSNLVF